MTDQEMAETLGISTFTFYKWKSEHPEFSEAVIAGKESTDDRVESMLLKRALGYTIELTKEVAVSQGAGLGSELMTAKFQEHYPPEPGALKLWLTNRRRDKWQDKKDVELAGKEGAPAFLVEFVKPDGPDTDQ